MALRRQAPAQPSRYLVGAFAIVGVVLVVSLRVERVIAERYGLAHPKVPNPDSAGDEMRDEGSQTVGAYGKERLSDSVAAYRRELAAHPRDKFPGDWAPLQTKLGNALREQAVRTSGPAAVPLLAEAASSLRASMEVLTRDKYPRHWAGAQVSLGIVLEKQADRAAGAEARRFLADSATAYEQALQVFTPATSPEEWATIELNLGALGFQTARGTEDHAIKTQALTASIAPIGWRSNTSRATSFPTTGRACRATWAWRS